MQFFFSTSCRSYVTWLLAGVFCILLAPVFVALAQFNPEINYQAKLTDSAGVAVTNGDYDIVFRLYTASSTGTAIWTESRTGADQVNVQNGLFSVMLGDVSSLAGVDFNQTLYLGVTVGADSEMTPRKVLGTVPAAFIAEVANNANQVGGVASSSFLRSDQADTMVASTTSSLLTINQQGAGNILDLLDNGTSVLTVADGGNVGIGTTGPQATLDVNGTIRLGDDITFTGGVSGNTVAIPNDSYLRFGASGQYDTHVLVVGDDFSGGGRLNFRYGSAGIMFDNVDGSARVERARLTPDGNFGLGTSTPSSRLTVAGDAYITGALRDSTNSAGTAGYILQTTGSGTEWVATSTLGMGGGSSVWTESGSDIFYDTGNVGIGTSTVSARLNLARSGFSGTGTVGLLQTLSVNQASTGQFAFGNRQILTNQSSATTTIAGDLIRIIDNTSFGNTVRGLEVQADFGSNTQGENTGISSFGRTFGVRGSTNATAGGTFAPAGIFAELTGAGTQGNALRAYSGAVTSATLVQILQDTTAYTGTALQLDMARDSGSFTGRFLDLLDDNISQFYVTATGTTYIRGNLGIGTTTPSSKLTVAGDAYITGALRDSSNSAGTNGYILQTTGSGTQWVATSTLGIGGGGSSTFLDLSDTPGSFTANRIPFTNAGATALTDNANFTFSGTNLVLGGSAGISLGGDVLLSRGAANRLDLATGDSLNLVSGALQIFGTNYLTGNNTTKNITLGELAGANFATTGSGGNIAIGYEAGGNASSTAGWNVYLSSLAGYNNTGQENFIFGYEAGYNNTGSWNFISGYRAGYNNTGSTNNILGYEAGRDNTGSGNNFLGYEAGRDNTGNVNNILGDRAGIFNTGSGNNFLGYEAGSRNTGNFNEFIGYEAGRNLRATSSVIIGGQAFRGTGSTPFSAVNNTVLGYQAGTAAAAGANNNILLGYRSGYSLTTGANNIIIGYDVEAPSNTTSNQLNIGNLIFGTGIDGTGTTLSSGNIGIGTTTASSKLTVAGDIQLYNTGASTISTNGTELILEQTGDQLGTTRLRLQHRTGSNGALFENTATTGTNANLVDFGFVTNSGTQQNIRYEARGNQTQGNNSYEIKIGPASSIDVDWTFLTGDAFTGFQGNVGIGTTTPTSPLTVAGDAYITGALRDSSNSAGTNGYILQTTGSGTAWVATSSLGIGGGSSITFGTGNQIPFMNSGGTDFEYSGSLTFDGSNLNLGGTNTGLAFQGTRMFYASTTNDSIAIGENAGATFTNDTTNNIAIGYLSAQYASTTFVDDNIFIGKQAGQNAVDMRDNIVIGGLAGQNLRDYEYSIAIGALAGQNSNSDGNNGHNIMIGRSAGADNTGFHNLMMGSWVVGLSNSGDYNNLLGHGAGRNNAGDFNDFIGFNAGRDNVGNYNIAIGESAGRVNTGEDNVFLGSLTGRYLQATNTVALGAGALYGPGANYQAVNNVALGYRAGYLAQTGASNNILLGYQAADSLTTGANNIIIGYDVEAPSNTASNQLNIGNLIFGTGIDGTGTTLSSGNIGLGTTSPSSKLDVWGDVKFGESEAGLLTTDVASNAVTIGTSSVRSALNIYGANTIRPGEMNIVGQTAAGTSTAAEDMVIRGDVMFLPGRAAGDSITAFDISDPTNPVELSTIVDSVRLENAEAVALSGDYLYVGANNHIAVVDVSNPKDMSIVGVASSTDFGSQRRMDIAGNFLYAGSFTQNKVNIVDITDPTSPTLINSFSYGGLNTHGVKVRGNFLYVTAQGSDALYIVDIRDPYNPYTRGVANSVSGDLWRDLDIKGNYAFAVNLIGNGLEAIDISDPDNPVIVDTLFDAVLLDAPSDVVIAGDYAFLALYANNYDNGIGIIDISDPTNMKYVTSIASTTLSAAKVGVQGNYLYAVGGDKQRLSVIDLGGLTAPSANIGSLLTQRLEADYLQVNKTLNLHSSLNVGGRAQFNGGISISGSASSSQLFGNQNPALIVATGNVGLGTTSPSSKLSLQNLTLDGAGVSGIDQYLVTTNSVASAVQFGNYSYLSASNTATTTLVGSMFKINDSTTFGNTVRGLEVQANQGSNTQGENTALSGFARTFGVRGFSSGDAGGTFEPAGGFFETGGTTQGNAIRGYSSSITTAALLSLFQDTSSFTGTGLEMNFGNTTGDFSATSSKYLDFQNAGTSIFTVSAFGTTTIGDGTTNNLAGLQIGNGGLCVDNDGSCNASVAGRIASVSTFAGNSDLAEIYFSSQVLNTGEVVTLAGELSVTRAEPANQLPILGVVSTKPGLLLGADDTSTRPGETGYPIALSGRVPVYLSTENGPIKKGDRLMLSSIPGVAMKATSTGTTIGMALEDFDESRYYSTTYLNQFGDDLVDPVVEPILTNTDTRINDGCYYSGGTAAGEAPCVPLTATTSAGQLAEANEIAAQQSVDAQLAELAAVSADTRTTPAGESVKVGQVVMFVQLEQRWIDDAQLATLQSLLGTSTITEVGENAQETLFDRLVALANSFVDGVLSIFELRVNRIEVADELCVDGVCVTADDLRALLDGGAATAPATTESTGSTADTTGPDTESVVTDPVVDSGTSSPDTTVNEENDSTPESDVSTSSQASSTPEVTEEEVVVETSATTKSDTEQPNGTNITDTDTESESEDVADSPESTSTDQPASAEPQEEEILDDTSSATATATDT